MTALRIAQWTTWPATRRLAETMRMHLGCNDDGGHLVIDFTDVEACTGGFADELVAAMVVEHADRVVVVGANTEVTETVRVALQRRGVALAGRATLSPGGNPRCESA